MLALNKAGHKFTVDITKEHFKKATEYKIANKDPLYLALKELYPDKGISIANKVVFIGGGGGYWFYDYPNREQCLHLMNLAKKDIEIKPVTVRFIY